MAREERALLIYDDTCAFCRLWIDHWRVSTGDRVQYVASREIAARFPDVPREKYARAVHLIDDDGTRCEGAEAVFRLQAKRDGFGWVKKAYDAPAVAPVSEWAYRFVARRRPFFLKLTRLLWGKKLETLRYGLTSRLFLQALSAVYFFAFISLFFQLPGLVGESGLLPARSFLEMLQAEHGVAAVWIAPTLAWFGAHAGALQFMALLGALGALLSFGGILLAPCFLLMWVLYLSLSVAGQSFAGFEWDLLLLEAGFLAVFLVPFRRAAGYRSRVEASVTVLWLYRFLLFRLFFASALIKLTAGGWRNVFGQSSYFETQPLPTAFAWFAHQAPEPFLKIAMFATFVFQLLLPFLFLLPRRARYAGALFAVAYHAFWLVMGDASFLHWLGLALCLVLLDDGAIERFVPRLRSASAPPPASKNRGRAWAISALAAILITLGLTRLIAPFAPVPTPALLLAATTAPLRISNDYGAVAAAAPESRQEIVFEGSSDGVVWKEYGFVLKPGDVKGVPGSVFPLWQRLDWQLSRAAYGEPGDNPWIANLMMRLLQGSKPVLALMNDNPFPEAPPQYVRATLYAYRFTTMEERARDGAWWRREMKASYFPTFSLGARPESAP